VDFRCRNWVRKLGAKASGKEGLRDRQPIAMRMQGVGSLGETCLFLHCCMRCPQRRQHIARDAFEHRDLAFQRGIIKNHLGDPSAITCCTIRVKIFSDS
jgi:hypothetical protein